MAVVCVALAERGWQFAPVRPRMVYAVESTSGGIGLFDNEPGAERLRGAVPASPRHVLSVRVFNSRVMASRQKSWSVSRRRRFRLSSRNVTASTFTEILTMSVLEFGEAGRIAPAARLVASSVDRFKTWEV